MSAVPFYHLLRGSRTPSTSVSPGRCTAELERDHCVVGPVDLESMISLDGSGVRLEEGQRSDTCFPE